MPRRPRPSGLREEGKTVVSIGWDDGPVDKPEDGPLIEHEPQPSNKD
jgi:hypothetical protein